MQSSGLAASRSLTNTFASTALGRIVFGFCATLLVALAAHIAFPLPFTPVPFTLQPLAVLGVGLFLGPVDAFLAMLAYLAEGASGLPVFSPTGLGGLAQLLGPTGGYLLAYPFVAALAGSATRRVSRFAPAFVAAALGCTAAVVLLFVAGAAWFGRETHLAWSVVCRATIWPFLPGEMIKVLSAAGCYRALKHPSQR